MEKQLDNEATGQRYEVRYRVIGTDANRRLGFTDKADGGKLMEHLKLLPSLDPYIVDRGESVA